MGGMLRTCGAYCCALLMIAVACRLSPAGPQVNYVLEDLFVTQSVPGSTVTTADEIASGSWSFSETNMNGLTTNFANNRHHFQFSEDGVNPIVFSNDLPWEVSFDIKLDATLVSPRKAFGFTLFNSGTNPSSADSQINLTTNRTPVPTGLNDPPGESAQFSGQFNFLRLIGPADGVPEINQNPTVGYVAGTTINMRIIHTPSPDTGTTPAEVEYIYTDGSGSYTTADSSGIAPADPIQLRNTGEFVEGYTMGFIIQGIAHSGTGTDSYGVTITNFEALIDVTGLPGDYTNDGKVDAADYTVWRNNLGDADETDLNFNGNGNDVSESDYAWWKQHYGMSNPGAGGGTGGLVGTAVPEPSTAMFVALAGSIVVCVSSRNRLVRKR